MKREINQELMRRIRAEFERVLEQTSVEANSFWQLKLFDETEEDFIRKEVDRKLYVPQLPNGGDMERRVVERLKKISRTKDFEDAWRAALAIKKWQAVLPDDPRNAGHYYTRTPMTPRSNKEDFEWFTERLKAANTVKDWEKKWFYELLLEGMPEPVANFEIRCLFLLKCADGNVQRLVELRNVAGESTGKVNLDSEAFHAPQKFRKWCLERGNFTWGAGEKELQKLHNDISRLAAWRVVNQVVTLGWLPLGERRVGTRVESDGIWFFGDCARANWFDAAEDGGEMRDEWLQQDADGIYWHRRRVDGEVVEEGYLVSESGQEGVMRVPFYQKKPMLHPDESILDLPLELSAHPELNFVPVPRGEAAPAAGKELDLDPKARAEREEELLRAFFREFCQRMQRTVGGEEANLLIGGFFSCAAAPEIFSQYSLFPGVWVHGQANSGKSTVCELLMEIWGFSLQSGMMLRGKTVSAIGLFQALNQYSNLWVWGDEYRNNEVDEDKMGALHNGYNRASQAKFNPSGFQRVVRTNFIVSGESTSNDAALRSRYPHVQMSATRRIGTEEEQKENFQWLLRHRKFFYLFGRYILENRRRFVSLVQGYLETWSREEIDPRLRIVHGVGYASWMAMASLLQSHSSEEVARFRKYMVEHSKSAAQDVVSELNVNVFVEELITAFKMGAIHWSCFKVKKEHKPHAPGHPGQPGWEECVLLIDPEPTIAALNIWLTKQRQTLTLKRKDLRDQLSRAEFWYQPEGKKLYTRFGGTGAVSLAWGIIADKHPLGYREVSDEEYEKFLLAPENGDPRKGPLYHLIEGVLEAQRKAANESN